MTTTAKPKFYKPNFGNDNFMPGDVVDIAAFSSPVQRRVDPAANSRKVAEQL